VWRSSKGSALSKQKCFGKLLSKSQAAEQELLQSCLERICRLTGWPTGHVYLPDDLHNPVVLIPSSVWHFGDSALAPLAEEIKKITMRITTLPTHLVEAQQLTVLLKPQDESQRTAQREIVAALHRALDARRQRIIISQSELVNPR
jgi:hypothetical protein